MNDFENVLCKGGTINISVPEVNMCIGVRGETVDITKSENIFTIDFDNGMIELDLNKTPKIESDDAHIKIELQNGGTVDLFSYEVEI